jgi:hypothetical protein
VSEYDREASITKRPWPAVGLLHHVGLDMELNIVRTEFVTQAEEGKLAFVNTLMNLRIPLDAGNTSTTGPSLSFYKGFTRWGWYMSKGKVGAPVSDATHLPRQLSAR